MSFKVKGEDLVGGRGKPLPNGTYLATVEQAAVVAKENGTQVERRYGSLRTVDGADEFELPSGDTYRIGNRKLFARSWWDHTNEQAASIGQRELMREAIALRLVAKPEKGQSAEFPFDTPEAYAEEITGREVKVRTRLKQRIGKDKKPVLDDDGQPVFEPEVVEYLAI